jgi:hypothetical protein
MTDKNTTADYNIKGFDRPLRFVYDIHDVQLGEEKEHEEGMDSICIQCGDDHSFRGNFEDAITFIDLLPELFPEIFKNNRCSSSGTKKLQEFVN